jgi:hypothetical protein
LAGSCHDDVTDYVAIVRVDARKKRRGKGDSIARYTNSDRCPSKQRYRHIGIAGQQSEVGRELWELTSQEGKPPHDM